MKTKSVHICLDSVTSNHPQGLNSEHVIRRGYYFRKSDGYWIRRFLCKSCGKSFSNATRSPCFGQKKRKLNFQVWKMLNSGVSQRRVAKLLGINPKTVVRKFRFLAELARSEHSNWLKELAKQPITEIQFDDLETAEHSKCKPLSVALAVEPASRKILSFQVSQMPAKGLLVKPALKKYGPRADLRSQGWSRLFGELRGIVDEHATWTSDENPHYPRHLKRAHPKAKHQTVESRRGCIAGQGELKKIGFDPLFSLNHTCAMLRANLNRLFRRTWCTTKTRQGLIDHLSIYVQYHNRLLTPILGQNTD